MTGGLNVVMILGDHGGGFARETSGQQRSTMELSVLEAKTRLSELLAAARNGERVILTNHGHPTAELERLDWRGGVGFDKLVAARRRLGIEGEGEGWPEEFNDPAFSRKVFGLDKAKPD